MAHSLSAKKRVRQNIKQRELNRARRSALKTLVRRVDDALDAGQLDAAEKALAAAVRQMDREATRGLIHRNAAARGKSRLVRRISSLKSKPKG